MNTFCQITTDNTSCSTLALANLCEVQSLVKSQPTPTHPDPTIAFVNFSVIGAMFTQAIAPKTRKSLIQTWPMRQPPEMSSHIAAVGNQTSLCTRCGWFGCCFACFEIFAHAPLLKNTTSANMEQPRSQRIRLRIEPRKYSCRSAANLTWINFRKTILFGFARAENKVIGTMRRWNPRAAFEPDKCFVETSSQTRGKIMPVRSVLNPFQDRVLTQYRNGFCKITTCPRPLVKKRVV